jgi:hypothetical protein
VLEVNTADPALRAAYARALAERAAASKRFFGQSKIGLLELMAGQPYQRRLQSFFEQRSRTKVA